MDKIRLRLPKEYCINSPIELHEINRGISSDAKLVITYESKYILRKLRNKEQALTEYSISQALMNENITSNILLTNKRTPYVIFENDIYNLQEHLKKKQVKNKDICYWELGKVTSLFHSRVNHLDTIFEQNDRFALNALWEEFEPKIELLNNKEKEEITNLVYTCLKYHHEKNCYIHGDLGIWNLLFNENEIYIIDFGEVRKGNNHFDIAAVISSTIDWNLEDKVIINSLKEFYNGYMLNFNHINWITLRESLNLWFARGIIAFLNNNGINNDSSEFLKIIMKRKNRLEEILLNHF